MTVAGLVSSFWENSCKYLGVLFRVYSIVASGGGKTIRKLDRNYSRATGVHISAIRSE
jgi:hypothetical protein